MYKQIDSIQNPLIKEILQLQEKSRSRKKKGLFIIEGEREIILSVRGGYKIETLLFQKDIISEEAVLALKEKAKGCTVISISREVYQKISHRKTTEGIVAIAKTKKLDLNNLQLQNNPLILVAEAPEKPGNIGALLRTADAAKIDAVLIANPKTDLYNPNIIRSSVGCIFTTQVATGSTGEIIDFLKSKNIPVFAAALHKDSKIYTEIDFRKSAAIAVGTEATGLSETWLSEAAQKIIIPMRGQIDSLNVSVSAAILIFEARRQRDEKEKNE